jgi:hypothetical protein
MLRRLWWWLRDVWRRRVVRVVSIPVPAECTHRGNPEATMHRLVAATSDPAQFAQVLAESGCSGCQAAILAVFAYSMAGAALVDQDDGESTEWVSCNHTSVSPEVIAMRLTLARAAKDGEVLGATLGEVVGCPDCSSSTMLSLVNAHVCVLNSTDLAWQPMVERRLLSLLDGEKK